MSDFVITCSTPCDMHNYYLRQHEMYYVGFYYYLNDEKFMDDFFNTHSPDEFYEKIRNCTVKTSQPDPEQYEKLWTKLIEQGHDILHIELSSGLSGAVNSALIAKSIVEEKYKNAKIHVVDSKTGSCGIGLLLDKMYKFKETCNDVDKAFEYAESLVPNINVVFAVENLDQLIKGGRVSKVAGSIGKILNIVPILHVNDEGKLENIRKARGLNAAIDELLNLMSSNIIDNESIYISNTNCLDNAKILFSKIKEKFPSAVLTEEHITTVGALIGCHLGKGALVVAYLGNGRA